LKADQRRFEEDTRYDSHETTTTPEMRRGRTVTGTGTLKTGEERTVATTQNSGHGYRRNVATKAAWKMQGEKLEPQRRPPEERSRKGKANSEDRDKWRHREE